MEAATDTKKYTTIEVAKRKEIDAPSLTKKLRRWTTGARTKHLFKEDQAAFIMERLTDEMEWPQWLVAIWEEKESGTAAKPTKKNSATKTGPVRGRKRKTEPEPQPESTPEEIEEEQAFQEELEHMAAILAGKARPLDGEAKVRYEQALQVLMDRPLDVSFPKPNGPKLLPNQMSPKEEEKKPGFFDNVVTFVTSEEFMVQKLILLGFVSFIFAILADYVFQTQAKVNGFDHEPPFWFLWVLGFVIDSAGFAVARSLPAPKYLSDGDPRKQWIGWFFAYQCAVAICFLFFRVQHVELPDGTIQISRNAWAYIAEVLVVIAGPLGVFAYSRTDFKNLITPTDKKEK